MTSETDEEPSWDSPWGKGRPGWHLECSVMSKRYLGEEFDIHGGGRDLIFPHHENEIAQSRCANETNSFANYWVHNGFITLSNEKMAKSQGNILKIKDFKNKYNGQVLRLALISAHYRKGLDWNEKLISECEKTLSKWYSAYSDDHKDTILPDELLDPLYDDLNTLRYVPCRVHKRVSSRLPVQDLVLPHFPLQLWLPSLCPLVALILRSLTRSTKISIRPNARTS